MLINKSKYPTKACKIISIQYHNDEMQIVNEIEEESGTGFNMEFVDLFYIIPVALLISIVIPFIYIIIYFKEIRHSIKKMINWVFKSKQSITVYKK